MLPVGALRQCNNPKDWTRFTQAEQRTMMSLWCMMRSPLMIGGELTKNDKFTLDLLTKRELLEIETEAWCAHPLRTTEEESIWIAPRKDGRGIYLALFNLSEKKRTVSVSAEEAECSFLAGKEIWTGRETRKAKQIKATLAPHDAAVYSVGFFIYALSVGKVLPEIGAERYTDCHRGFRSV